MLIFSRAIASARDPRGFTLIEVLVAMVTGVIVTGALFAILEVSTRQAARVSEVAQATQVGRTAMTHVVDELHSACLSAGFTPVKSGTTATKLVFVNGYFPEHASEVKEPEYTFVNKNVIEYVPAKGRLTDVTSKATGEPVSGEYPWKETNSSTLAENISHAVIEGKEEPIFKYYAYKATPTTNTSEAASTLKELTPEAAEKTPASVAAVGIAFRTAPYRKEARLSSTAELGTSADQTTLTIFALGAPNSEAKIEAGPCE